MKSKDYVGINIQWPISELIAKGSKKIETRFYPLPSKYVGQDLIFIETPGPGGNFKSRMVGMIRFGEPFEYRNKKEFYADFDRHKVGPKSEWAWQTGKNKWGWPIEEIRLFDEPKSVGKKRGIVFRTGIKLSSAIAGL